MNNELDFIQNVAWADLDFMLKHSKNQTVTRIHYSFSAIARNSLYFVNSDNNRLHCLFLFVYWGARVDLESHMSDLDYFHKHMLERVMLWEWGDLIHFSSLTPTPTYSSINQYIFVSVFIHSESVYLMA